MQFAYLLQLSSVCMNTFVVDYKHIIGRFRAHIATFKGATSMPKAKRATAARRAKTTKRAVKRRAVKRPAKRSVKRSVKRRVSTVKSSSTALAKFKKQWQAKLKKFKLDVKKQIAKAKADAYAKGVIAGLKQAEKKLAARDKAISVATAKFDRAFAKKIAKLSGIKKAKRTKRRVIKRKPAARKVIKRKKAVRKVIKRKAPVRRKKARTPRFHSETSHHSKTHGPPRVQWSQTRGTWTPLSNTLKGKLKSH